MELNFKNYNIQDTVICECGYEFNLKNITKLEKINSHGFYSNIVKHYSKTMCPNCKKETILLLKQKGQTWEILSIANPKLNTENQVKIENKEKNINNQEFFICPECKKVCKSQFGLNAHMKTHNK